MSLILLLQQYDKTTLVPGVITRTRCDNVYLARTCLARPNSQAQTRRGKYLFSLFSWPRAGVATLPGWSLHAYSHRCSCGVMSCRKRRGWPGMLPSIFLFFSPHPIKGYLQFYSTFFSATEFPHFCSFLFCFAACHKKWPEIGWVSIKEVYKLYRYSITIRYQWCLWCLSFTISYVCECMSKR